jgi:hypothetical protein
LIFDRITYIFYIYPVVGSICLGAGLSLNRILEFSRVKPGGLLRVGIWSVGAYLFCHLVIFILFSPLVPPLVQWLKI